jgi:hypothetical protein
MSIRTCIKTMLLTALVALAVGGLFLHLRIHPIAEHGYNWIPFVSGVLSVIAVPLLFGWRRTVHYGYVLNGFLVILGIVTMAHFSCAHWPSPVTVGAVLLRTTLADILILTGKFFVGKALFDLELHGYDATQPRKGVSWRYPNLGWWLVHLGGIAVVYWLGNLVWR